jgi:hypothetical protein
LRLIMVSPLATGGSRSRGCPPPAAKGTELAIS